jgi:hypothetical protein
MNARLRLLCITISRAKESEREISRCARNDGAGLPGGANILVVCAETDIYLRTSNSNSMTLPRMTKHR